MWSLPEIGFRGAIIPTYAVIPTHPRGAAGSRIGQFRSNGLPAWPSRTIGRRAAYRIVDGFNRSALRKRRSMDEKTAYRRFGGICRDGFRPGRRIPEAGAQCSGTRLPERSAVRTAEKILPEGGLSGLEIRPCLPGSGRRLRAGLAAA